MKIFSKDFTIGHQHEEDEANRGRYLRSCTTANTPAATAAYHHPHEFAHGYDPMEAAEIDRHYHQQRPVDLGYNNR